ncbi:hypothetical protein PoB_004155200 [Plakobranchus ocellatus]|uniref:Uncharacterized protein n=1 Tax=Plakobranchus ocellatus TaxID=259542 RepID=A0AAV4B7I4_9GAST|nr:hypothetical protein PoB_004155200 [Plakobranchus ocellatus]
MSSFSEKNPASSPAHLGSSPQTQKRALDKSYCWLRGLLGYGDLLNMTTLATSNTHSSRFLTPVLAIAIELVLIAAHWEQDVVQRIRALKGQDNDIDLNFVLTPTHLDVPRMTYATQIHLQATP